MQLEEGLLSSTATLDAPLRELLERIEPHADLASPELPAIGNALLDLAADHDYFAPGISAMQPDTPIVPLILPQRGPRLMLVHREPGQMSAVHDHGVWVALAPIVGVETHRHWRPLTPDDRTRLQLAEDEALGPPSCKTMQPPDDIHDHGHLIGRGDAAYMLILLGDDQVAYRRNEWEPETGRHRVLEPGDRGRWIAGERWPD